MKDWRTWKVGDKVHFHSEEFDGTCDFAGAITKAESTHSIMTDADGTNYWIDDDTAFQFRRA